MENKYNPKVSIVMATYNSSRTVLTALKSIKKQTYKNIELVVVDGKSLDSTVQIVKDWDFDNKIIISEKDRGIFDALNKGVKVATGDYIFVLGSDDELLPNGIKSLVDNSHGYDIVYGDAQCKFSNGTLVDFKAKDYHCLNHIICCSHQAMIMTKKSIEEGGYFNLNYPLRADFALMQKVYLLGYKFKKIESVICYFAPDGAGSKAKWTDDFERYRIIRDNKASKFPFIIFAVDELKVFIRKYIYNPNRKTKI